MSRDKFKNNYIPMFFHLKQCVKDKPGNVIISSLSVSTALALLSQAAGGNTYEQLKQALHLSDEKSDTANQFFEHSETLVENAGEATLSIANGIYVQDGEQLNKNFQESAVSKFKSGVESLNFVDSAKSAATINHFVEEKTNGKIKDLFKPDQFHSDTRSVLVNAVHFKGAWEKPFHSESTRKHDFYNSETETTQVDFMKIDSTFNAANIKDLEAKAIELKYENSNISFVIVLPKSRTGLPALEVKLKDYDLGKIAEQLNERRYAVRIPKFKVEYDINLNNVLKNVRNILVGILILIEILSFCCYFFHLDGYDRNVFE